MSQHLTTSSIPVPGTSQPSTPRQPRRRRWRRVVLGLLALFLFVFWFAPTIVAKTPLRNRIARAVAADLKGTLEIGGASLGWLSPIELRDVTLTDAQGRVMARIPKLTSSKTLLSLLRDRDDLGGITLERPSLEIVCEKDSSNLEESIEQYLRSPECPGPTRTAIVVNVVQGSLALKEAGRDGGGDIHNIDATVTIPISRAEPIAARVSADAPGRVEAELSAGDGGTMKLAANGLGLEYLAPVLQRIDQGMSLAGAMTADCTAAWGKDSASIEGKLAVRSLSLSLPEMNGETLRLADAELPVKAAIVGRTVRIDRADLTCDIGTVSVVGRFDPEESFDRFLQQEAVKLDAAVDIAKLAAALPKLLHVRDGTEFREGKLVVKVASKHGEHGTTWTGGISTSALKALRDGREIKWEEPLDIQFEGHANPSRLPTLEKLTCKSDFIGINAQVSPDSVRAAANIYLDKLAERLAEFVDLQGWTLDGRGSAWIIASRTASGEFKAEGGVELARFAMLDRAGKGIREPELKMQLAATGYAAENKPVTVTTMSVSLAAGKDDLRVKLLEPIPDIKELSGGKFDATVDGELSRWWKRLGLGVSLPQDYVVAGKITARGVGSFASGTLKVNRLALAIEHPRFRGAGIDLSEPKLNAEADVVVDRKRH
ncbi:MAG TPA: hypothetical protein VLM40_01930, partial [Gemmata sp.]|nr:hypothetical protein [Gemmata sp.]